MKKLIWIVFISLYLSSSAYAKIDDSYQQQVYYGCINDAKKNNDYNSASKNFCKCYANQFNKKFNNEQLVKFLSKSPQEQAQMVENEIAPPCYSKSNTSQSSSKSKIVLKDCWWTGWTKKSDFRNRFPEYYYEIDIKKRTIIRNLIFSDAFHKRRKKYGPEPIHRKLKFDIITFNESYIETDFENDGWNGAGGKIHPYRIILKIDLKRNFVEENRWDLFDINEITLEKRQVQCTR